jgi:ABC-type Fe3+/spermidine/putrescine transport system ATPase subunit
MASIEIRNLVKRFKNGYAVDHVSLRVESGQIVSLLGPSGCGKTTTLRCIAGLEKASGGEIYIGDRCVDSPTLTVPPEKRDIGLVFQSYALWPHMTVFQIVALGLELRRKPKDEIRERVLRVLASLELAGLDQRYPSQLSGGQQQRVALARSIAIEPQVLLFDEPLSNLDAKIRERVRLELHDILKRLGITSLYVTHDQSEAMALSDHIVVMNQGRIEQQGTAKELYERPTTRFVADFIGWANFVPVRVRETGGAGRLSVLESTDGLRFASTTEARGEAGVVAFRPEHARLIAAQTAGDNEWPVAITKQVYLGSTVESHARLGEATVRLVGAEAPVGEQVRLHVPADRLLYFPSAA